MSKRRKKRIRKIKTNYPKKIIINTNKNNFLNNQNYIFWNFEKRKLLNKFFLESSFKNFKKKLFFISNSFIKNIFLYLFYPISISTSFEKNFFLRNAYITPSILLTGIIFTILWISTNNNKTIIIWFFSLLFYIITNILYIIFFKNNKKILKIKYPQDYNFLHITKLDDINLNYLKWKIFPLSIFFIFSNQFDYIFKQSELIWMTLFFSLIFIIIYFRLLNIFFLPFIFTYYFIYNILLYIKYIIIWLKWYNFIKKTSYSNISKSFYILEENYAENQYYKLEIKK